MQYKVGNNENVEFIKNGVTKSIFDLQDALTFDNTPTEDSTNPVTSGGVYTALANMTSVITATGTLPAVEDAGVMCLLTTQQTVLQKVEAEDGDEFTLPIWVENINESPDGYVSTPYGTSPNQYRFFIDANALHCAAWDGSDISQDNWIEFSATPVTSDVTMITYTGTFPHDYSDAEFEIDSAITSAGVKIYKSYGNVMQNVTSFYISDGNQWVSLNFDDIPTTSSNNLVNSGDIKSYVDSHDALLVTFTPDSLDATKMTCDHTAAQIMAANDAGQLVFGVDSDNGMLFKLSACNDTPTLIFVGFNISVLRYVSYDGTDWNVDDYEFEQKLTFDSAPTANSTNPVTSGGIYAAIQAVGTPNSIASITTTESAVGGGTNTITITETNGDITTLNVKNGADGVSLGDVQIANDLETDDSTKVLSAAQGVVLNDKTNGLTDQDLAGTSDYVRQKLVEAGWVFDKALDPNGNYVDFVGWCVTPMFDLDIDDRTVNCGSIFVHFNDNVLKMLLLYDENGNKISNTFLYGSVYGTPTIAASSYKWRAVVLPENIVKILFLNHTEGKTIFVGQEYLRTLLSEKLVGLGTVDSKDCSKYDYQLLNTFNWVYGYLDNNGQLQPNANQGVTDFISLDNVNLIKPLFEMDNTDIYKFFFYDENYNFLYKVDYGGRFDELGVSPVAKYLRIWISANLSYDMGYISNFSIKLYNAQNINERFDQYQVDVPKKIIHCTSIQVNGKVYSKLDTHQVQTLNNSDTISIRWLVNGMDGGSGAMEWRYMSMGAINKANLMINTTFWGAPYLFNRASNNANTAVGAGVLTQNATPHDPVTTLVLNRITGNVRYYRGVDLICEETSDDYKCDKFIGDDGALIFAGGDQNSKFYGMQFYDCDIMKWTLQYGEYKDNVLNATISEIPAALGRDTYKKSHTFAIEVLEKPYGTGTGATNQTVVINGNISTVTRNDGKAGVFFFSAYTSSRVCHEHLVNFTIDRKFRYNYAGSYIVLWDSNGNLIEEIPSGVSSSIFDAGTYTALYCLSISACALMTTEDGATLTFTRQVRNCGCIAHFKCNVLYDNKIWDDVANKYYTFYTNTNCTKASIQHSPSQMPLRSPVYSMGDLIVPHFRGELKVWGGRVYVADQNYTWKQINNS